MSGASSALPRLFDAHCHLQDPRIPEGEVAQVLEGAAEQGVCRFSCNGCRDGDWDRVAQLAQEQPRIVPNFGLHPWWIDRRSDDWLQRLRSKLEQNPRAGLGECGLDKGPKAPQVELPLQLELFEQQLQLAQELRRPLSVHCVRAFGHVHGALAKHGIDVPVVLHSWTGSEEMVVTFLQLPRVFFSLSGHLTKLPPNKAIPMVRRIPLDRLLLESDSPDGSMALSDAWQESLPGASALVPQLERYQQRNEPSSVRLTLKLVALILGLPEEEVAQHCFSNAEVIWPSG